MVKRTNDEIITGIQILAEEIGRTPTATEFKKLGKIPISTIIHRFERYNLAIEAAGLNPRPKNLSDEFILGEIRRIHNLLGRAPSCSEFKKLSKISVQTVFRRFKTFPKALNKAGYRGEALEIEDFYRDPSPEEFLTDLDKVWKRLGRMPKIAEYEKFGKFTYYRLRRALGGMRKAKATLLENTQANS